MPITRPFTRRSGFRDATLLVIATEGERTEQAYFNALKKEYHKPSVHIEVLQRSSSESSPEHVLRELVKFKVEYKLQRGDQLWMVIDVDRWPEQNLSGIARICNQKGFFIAVSNPCFELWLFLHLSDLQTDTSMLSCKQFEQLIRDLLGSYNKSNPSTEVFIQDDNLNNAITRAESLDKNMDDRWPQTAGSRVYLLIRSIINRAEDV
jgi:hypothetical protein